MSVLRVSTRLVPTLCGILALSLSVSCKKADSNEGSKVLANGDQTNALQVYAGCYEQIDDKNIVTFKICIKALNDEKFERKVSEFRSDSNGKPSGINLIETLSIGQTTIKDPNEVGKLYDLYFHGKDVFQTKTSVTVTKQALIIRNDFLNVLGGDTASSVSDIIHNDQGRLTREIRTTTFQKNGSATESQSPLQQLRKVDN